MCLGHLSTLRLKGNEPDGLQIAEIHPNRPTISSLCETGDQRGVVLTGCDVICPAPARD